MTRREELLLSIIVNYVGCPYKHFTDKFYKESNDPNLPNWYFYLCGDTDRFKCKETDDIVKNCWLRFIKEE